jgi:hypothetical protein
MNYKVESIYFYIRFSLATQLHRVRGSAASLVRLRLS